MKTVFGSKKQIGYQNYPVIDNRGNLFSLMIHMIHIMYILKNCNIVILTPLLPFLNTSLSSRPSFSPSMMQSADNPKKMLPSTLLFSRPHNFCNTKLNYTTESIMDQYINCL